MSCPHLLLNLLLLLLYSPTSSNIYLPTTTIDITKELPVVDVFRSVSFQSADPDSDEKYNNVLLQNPANQSNKVNCLYMAAFSQTPTIFQRDALYMVVGGEKNIIRQFREHTFLIFCRRSTATAALVSIDKLKFVGKYLAKYKYTQDLLVALARPEPLVLSLTFVPSADLNQLTRSIVKMFSIKTLKVFSSIIEVSLDSSIPKTNYNMVKKIGQFCEVIKLDVVHGGQQQLDRVRNNQDDNNAPKKPGRTSLLLHGKDELTHVIDSMD